MARSIRLEYREACYHVMARGNRRQAIFRDDPHRADWLRALAEPCGRTGWRVHAWVLMSNHYHLFVETPEPNLVAGMKRLQNIALARTLWASTTVSQPWIAEHLHMKSAAKVSQILRRAWGQPSESVKIC